MRSKIDSFTYQRLDRKYWHSLIGDSKRDLVYLTAFSMTQKAFYFISKIGGWRNLTLTKSKCFGCSVCKFPFLFVNCHKDKCLPCSEILLPYFADQVEDHNCICMYSECLDWQEHRFIIQGQGCFVQTT